MQDIFLEWNVSRNNTATMNAQTLTLPHKYLVTGHWS